MGRGHYRYRGDPPKLPRATGGSFVVWCAALGLLTYSIVKPVKHR